MKTIAVLLPLLLITPSSASSKTTHKFSMDSKLEEDVEEEGEKLRAL